jgi:uncharacterized protein involved in outer membrane biogenesis
MALMKRLGLTVWVLTVLLAAAIACAPLYLDAHKGLIAARASESLGRSVRINGPVQFSWLPRPSFVIDDIDIAGADGSTPSSPWHVGRLQGDLDLAALFDRRIRIGRLLLHDMQIHLAPGRPWNLQTSGPSSGTNGFRFSIDAVTLSESTLVLQAAQRDSRTVRITRLDLQGLGSPSRVLDGEISVSGTPLAISASAGPQADGTSPRLPFEIRMRLADVDLEASGMAPASFDLAGIEADVALSGQDLTALQGLVPGLALPGGAFRVTGRLTRPDEGLQLDRIEGSLDSPELPGPVSLSDGTIRTAAGSLTARLDGGMRQTPFNLELELTGHDPQAANASEEGTGHLDIGATLGDARLAGKLSLTRSGPRPRVAGSLSLENIDPASLGALQWPTLTSHQTNAWLDKPIPVERLRRLDLDVDLTIAGLNGRRGEVGRLATRIRLDEGLMRLDSLRVALPGMTLAGEAALDVRPDRPAWSANLKADPSDLPAAFAFFASAPPPTVGRLERVSLDAEARGVSARELIESLDAELEIAEVRLGAPSAVKQAADGVRLTRSRLIAKPGRAVQMQTAVAAGGQAFDLDLVGGLPADLLSRENAWPKMDIVARQHSGAQGAEIRGVVGPVAALLAGRNLNLDLSLLQPGLRMAAKGRLARLDGLDGSELDVEAEITDLAVLGDLLDERVGKGFADGPPVAVTARLVGLGQGLELRNLNATSGLSDLAGDLIVRPGSGSGLAHRVEATLMSQTLDLTPYLGIGTPKSDSAPSAAPHAPHPDMLQSLDGVLRLKTMHLRAGDLGFEMLDLNATSDAGHLHASLAVGAERLVAEIDLRPRQDAWQFDIRTRGQLDLSSLLQGQKAKALAQLPAALDARFSGVATSVEGLLGGADGYLVLELGSGQLDKKVADLLPLGGLLFSLLDAINPLDRRSPHNDLQCAVLQFDLADGIAVSTRGLAVQTKEINAIGGGAINLRNEAIEIRFKTAKRRGVGLSMIGIADRFVYVTGTLSDPRAGIDPAALLVHGGAAWATSGITLLADQLLRRLTSAANPCDAVRSRR